MLKLALTISLKDFQSVILKVEDAVTFFQAMI